MLTNGDDFPGSDRASWENYICNMENIVGVVQETVSVEKEKLQSNVSSPSSSNP